jgi:hypothetical protein
MVLSILMYEYGKFGAIQVGWGMFMVTEENILSFYRQLKLLKTHNIQEVHKNKILNGSNNYLFIQKIIQVKNQLIESKLNLLFLYMFIF